MPLATHVGHSTAGICDLGLPCCPHSRSGTNSEGTPLLEIEGNPVHLVSHHGPTNCPHAGVFVSTQGSGLIEVEGIPVTLVGHTTQCEACGKPGSHNQGSRLLEVDF